MKFTASEIAEQVGGEVVGDGGIELAGFAQADAAKLGDLTFAENEKYFRLAEESPASAILAPEEFASETKTVIRVKNARIAFARVLPLLFPEKEFASGIHPSAVIADSAQVAGTAHIGPNCVIGESAAIGEQTVLEANCTVGDHSALGQAVRLFANVTIYSQCRIGDRVRIHAGTVIGSDGFGFAFDGSKSVKFHQLGGIVIGDDVEIGAGSTIDRGALDDTVIERGVKLDNMVHIGHNCRIGEHTVICGCSGLGGSTIVGKYCVLGGGVGVIGHLSIADRVQVSARTLISRTISEPGMYSSGTGQMKTAEWKRSIVRFEQLDSMAKRIKALEKSSGSSE